MSKTLICKDIVAQVNNQLEKILSLRQIYVKKGDNSFVSKGDLLVQDIIIDIISKSLPDHILISEELAPFSNIRFEENLSYVILDPIDGTENFISGLREWGIGVSIYTKGKHDVSLIFLPELQEYLYTGMKLNRYKSRIIGLSSSLTKNDLSNLPDKGFEFRIIGCSMYNMLSAVKGSFYSFENVKGVNCWDILPGLNLAIEHGVSAYVDGEKYMGNILFPNKKYRIKITSENL